MQASTRKSASSSITFTLRLNQHRRLTRGEIRKHCVELTSTLVVHPSPKISARANRPFGECLPPPAEHGRSDFVLMSWERHDDSAVAMMMTINSELIARPLTRRCGRIWQSVAM